MSEVNNNKFIIRVKLEYAEYKAAIKGVKKRKTIMTWAIYFFILILDLLSILILHIDDIKKGSVSMMVNNSMTEVPIYIAFLPTIVFLVFLTLIIVGFRLKFFYSIKREYQTNPQLQKETKYTFMEEGVEIVSDSLNTKVRWREFKKIKETKEAVLLFLSKKNVWIIPKGHFSKEEFCIFKNLYYSGKNTKL